MSIPTFTKSGNKATTSAKLNKDIFDVEVKSHSLLKQAYIAYQANGRKNLAKTLKRGEVSGGGKKPWKQKGTGRARFGSIRVPIWRGGGIVFGPLGKENYSKTLTVKSKKQAIKQALSIKQEKIIVLETFECKDGKTAETVKLLNKLGANRKTLLVVSNKDELVLRATKNVKDLKVVNAMYLNVFDILNADHIVISQKSLEIIDGWLGASEHTSASKEEAKK